MFVRNAVCNDVIIGAGNVKVLCQSIISAPTNCAGYIIGGATDKSLARPGRKQATATKLGIYSTYSHEAQYTSLPVALTFASHSKKIQKIVLPIRSPRQQLPPRRTKNGDLSIVFSVQGTGDSRTGPDPENWVGDQDIGSPGRSGAR